MKNELTGFEDNITRLEQIVRSLEKGEASLAESLELFQEGTELVRKCESMLEIAELQVSKMTSGANGEPVEEAL